MSVNMNDGIRGFIDAVLPRKRTHRREAMSKHTPGPWYVERLCQIKGSDGYYVAKASTDRSATACADNAHLIAAAPELLEAANKMSRALFVSGVTTDCVLREAWQVLDAAIKKAEGGGS